VLDQSGLGARTQAITETAFCEFQVSTIKMLKLISWNIAGWINEARTAQLEWLVGQQADILAFQEVREAYDLQKRLSKLDYKYFDATKSTGRRNKLVAIASRLPFTVITTFAVPYRHRKRAISCRISLMGKQVELHCVHVPNGSDYGSIKIEFLEAIKRGLSNRKRPQLLVGDFNCPRFIERTRKHGIVVVTWAQRRRRDGTWEVKKTRDGIAGARWHKAEQSILDPRSDMRDVFTHLNGAAKAYSYKGNRYDHMIASDPIMPSTIHFGTSALKKSLSDHAPLVAEWHAVAGR
jgi:exonuclease III